LADGPILVFQQPVKLGGHILILDFKRWRFSLLFFGEGEKHFTQVGPQQAFDIIDTTCLMAEFLWQIAAATGASRHRSLRSPARTIFRSSIYLPKLESPDVE
jgi:hypothetical protein